MQSQFLAEFLKIINHTDEASDGKHAEGFLAASFFCNRTTVCSFNYYTKQIHVDMGPVQSVCHQSQKKLEKPLKEHQLRNPWKGSA